MIFNMHVNARLITLSAGADFEIELCASRSGSPDSEKDLNTFFVTL